MDVYVINLDRQTARLRWMEQGLGAAGVAFRRMPAVNAERLSPSCVERLTASHPYKLSRFDVALIMSHRRVWRALLRSPDAHCLVFEDDVHLGHGFADFLAGLDSGNAPFDLVKLESVGERVLIDIGRARRVGGRDLCPLRSSYMGTAGYVVTRKAAVALLRVTRSMAVPIDWFLFADSYLASNGLAVLQVVPGIVAQEEHLRRGQVPELLSWRMKHATGTRASPKPGMPRKVWREAMRPFRQAVAALARYRLMRAEPGLRWGRIEFE